MTVRSILSLTKTNPFCIRKEIRSPARMRQKSTASKVMWACPKYDGTLYDEDFLEAFLSAVTDETVDAAVARRLGFITDQSRIDHYRILEVTRMFTVVIAEGGRIMEHHKDFAIHAETEHARWIEHVLGFQNHAPVDHARGVRLTGRSAGPGSKLQGTKAQASAKVKKYGGGGGRQSRLSTADSTKTKEVSIGSCEFFGNGGPDDTITIYLWGQGRHGEFARLTVRRGITAGELQLRVAGLMGNAPEAFNLMNLDNPMILVGGMRLLKDTRVAVAPRVRGG